MTGPAPNTHSLAEAVAEANALAATGAAAPPMPTPIITTVGDATAGAPPATSDGQPGGALGRGKRGAFIVLEGLDRSGKTTQVERLQSKLLEAGKQVGSIRFPDRTTPTGQIINQYLSSSTSLPDQSIHLLFTANRWESAPAIAAHLNAGTSVVCDRYYYSGMVYSAAKGNPQLTLPWARAPEVGLPRPDVVVFLDLSEEVAKERGGYGEERYETREMQGRVKELFWGLKKGVVEVGGEEVRFGEESEDLVVVDAGRSVDEVAADVWSAVAPRVAEVERGDLGSEVRKVL